MQSGVREAFDELVARADAAMVVVTVAAGDERSGCLVGFHAQCGMDPPRYALWVSHANHTHGVAARASTFAVHFLRAADRELAELFGGTSGDDVDKFAQCRWTAGPDGVPLLDACPDRFVGRRVDWVALDADHTCAVIEPFLAEVGTAAPRLRLTGVTDLEPGHEAEE
jgi:flavin reductase (DIM6/NTAB) family NADH-FMN oxidoreductase RutF